MTSRDDLRPAVLDILEQHGPIGTGALVQQLETRGHQPLPHLWPLLDTLRDEGLATRSGPLARQTWDIMRAKAIPDGDQARSSAPASAAPELDDPATFLDLPTADQGPHDPAALESRDGRRRGRPANAPRTSRYKGLTRCDYPQKHMVGYLVRVRWNNVLRQRFFADHKHGDRLGALAAALEWRDATERELGKPRSETPVPGTAAASNTGVRGITRTLRKGRPVLQLFWLDADGKVHRTSVAISKYGEAGAMRRAKEILRRARAASPNVPTSR